MKKLLSAFLLALICLTGQAKTYKTIQAPESMACVNMNGELKAHQVIMRDTATTVHFTMVYPKGQKFRYAHDSYLMDEDGNRYPLRSCEGLQLDTWVQSPESGTIDFTMHFQPLSKKVQMFDFIEGDGMGAFMLLGIHDKKLIVTPPTLQQLSDANPYQAPADWLKTDTITIRGCIEGYDAEKFGFTSLECFHKDVFENDDPTLVIDIAPDGSFEKKFQASYPVYNEFFTRETKVGFSEIPFFARPGETIDITVRPNESGQYECIYNSGSSKDVARWLKLGMTIANLSRSLPSFKGKFSEIGEEAERTWQNLLYRLQMESRRLHFTPQEMQLALADLQVSFAYALMDFPMYHENEVVKYEQRDGGYQMVILDSAEWKALDQPESYKALRRIDFDNPLLLSTANFPILLNRIQYAKPVRNRRYEGLANEEGAIESNAENEKKMMANSYKTLREMLGTDHDSFMAQLCTYNDMLNSFNAWRNNEEALPRILVDTTLTVKEREEAAATIQTPDRMMPAFLASFTNPVIRQKAEAFYAYKIAQTDLSTPLPVNSASAGLIRRLCDKYPGRYLLIDFWGMGCGPCKSAIQSSKDIRAEIAKRDDVKLIFIAGERTAEGSEAYHQYVKEWLADEETICVTNNDFTRLQELFRFNGIPHYETITPDCRRVRDDLQIHGFHGFDYEMQILKEKLK
jgi:thiol-disulfide isomerase/thioredoxin